MGIMSKITKSGIAKKAVDQARKPENKAKIQRGVDKAKTYAAQRKGKSTG